MKACTQIWINLGLKILGEELVIISVSRNLVGIHDGGWHFDSALSKAEIVVALQVSDLLNFVFGEVCGVDNNLVVDMESCG